MLTLQTHASGLFPHLTVQRFAVTEALTFLTTPNNCYDLFVVLGGEVGLATARYSQGRQSAVLLGMSPRSLPFTFTPGTVGLHLRLAPHHLACFVGLPLRELALHPLDLAEVWGRPAANLPERIAAAGSLTEQVGVVEEFLAGLYRARDTRVGRQVAALAATDGAEFSVKRLRDHLDLSERQLERLFAEQLGASPRAYVKVCRFQRVVARFAQQPVTAHLLPLALNEGYYDQSHFIRDCKQLTGRTPTAYFATMDPVLSGSYNT